MNKQKKIVFIVPEFLNLSETFILAQIITATKLGYKVQIIARKLLASEVSLRSNLIDEYDLLNKVIIEDYKIPKNKIIRLLKWFTLLTINLKDFNFIFKYYKEQPKFSLTWLFQWAFYNEFKGVDIFHVQYGTNSNPLATLKKTGFKPALVVTFHGHDAFFPISGYIPNNGYYDNLFKYGNLITANTPYLAEKIVELGCPTEKLIVIPVGVDTNFFYSNKGKRESNETLKMITVGRLDKVKGHFYCIEAVHQLINNGIDVTLTIIGEGKERDNLQKLIVEYQLEEKIFMKGKKSPAEVRQALWNHDVYLLTAVALADGRRETQGLATLEAQACGLPVIVFDSGGVKYTMEDGVSGYICDEFDIEAVGNKILKFIEEPSLISIMSGQAVTFVNKFFSQKAIDKKWEILYNDLSNGK